MEEPVRLTTLQLSLLDVLWARGEASTQEVWETVREERDLALSTVATLLSRLEKKGVLTHRQAGRQYVYRATVSRAAVRTSKIRTLTETLFDGDPAALVSHLVRADAVDAADLERIRQLIDEADADSPAPSKGDG